MMKTMAHMNTAKPKRTNIETMFYVMVVVAWAIIALALTAMHRQLPRTDKPADATAGKAIHRATT